MSYRFEHLSGAAAPSIVQSATLCKLSEKNDTELRLKLMATLEAWKAFLNQLK